MSDGSLKSKKLKAALKIQSLWRGHCVRKQKERKSVLTVDGAIPNANQYFSNAQDQMHEFSGSKIRETRPPFKYKSGAVYEGEWVGSARDGMGI